MREAVLKTLLFLQKIKIFSRGNEKAFPFQPYLYVPFYCLSQLFLQLKFCSLSVFTCCK
jgi:hypothetical protein